MMRFFRLRKIFISAILFAWPVVVNACSVCGGGTKEKADAYIVFTAILASLPVIMFGLLFTWLYRQYRKTQ